MKFMITVDGRSVLLTEQDLDRIVPVLNEAEEVDNKWVGTGKGDNGGDYIRSLKPCNRTPFTLRAMTDEEYNLLKFLKETRDKQTS